MDLKLFEIDEAGCVKTWAAATSAEEAERLALAFFGNTPWEDPEDVLVVERSREKAEEMMVVDSDSEIAVNGRVSLWALFQHAKHPQVLCCTEY